MQMYEFATGFWLFPSEDDGRTRALQTRLVQIRHRTGEAIPQHMLDACPFREELIDLGTGSEPSLIILLELDIYKLAGVEPLLPIEEAISPSRVMHHSREEIEPFLSVMKAFLRVDPADRPTARQALERINWALWE